MEHINNSVKHNKKSSDECFYLCPSWGLTAEGFSNLTYRDGGQAKMPALFILFANHLGGRKLENIKNPL